MSQRLGDVVDKIRSKNAGPFWVTIDIFCGDERRYNTVLTALDDSQVCASLHLAQDQLKRFDLPDLHAIKFSFARPIVQGSAGDRDMHGAQYAVLIAQLPIS